MQIEHVHFRLLKDILKEITSEHEQTFIVFLVSTLMTKQTWDSRDSKRREALKLWVERTCNKLDDQRELPLVNAEPLKLSTLWAITTQQVRRNILSLLSTRAELEGIIAEVAKLMLLYLSVYLTKGKEQPDCTILRLDEGKKRKISVKKGVALELSSLQSSVSTATSTHGVIYLEVSASARLPNYKQPL